MENTKFKCADRISGFGRDTWTEIANLTAEHNAVNLAMGNSDYLPPSYITQELVNTVSSPDPALQQYSRSAGHLRLVRALGSLYSPLMGVDIEPLTDILVTSGAFEALFCSVFGYIDPGDEVILIEPFFDCYERMVKMAGGVPVCIPLKPVENGGSVLTSADWMLDIDELSTKFSKSTKMIILNNPNNPTGKVFSKDELSTIAALCQKYDVICISDEVYEWMVYPPKVHIKIVSLPRMWERTITIGSAGKTFNVTGWRIGWAVGPDGLMKPLKTVHASSVSFCTTHNQEAVARLLEIEHSRFGQPECYLNNVTVELTPKRDRMKSIITDIGMRPCVPDAGYFMLADFSSINNVNVPTNSERKDLQFAKWLIINQDEKTLDKAHEGVRLFISGSKNKI